MSDSNQSKPRQFIPVLLVLFIGSGCSALIYEIVWFQLLRLVIGSSAVSLGVLLGTFMGGMCLGSIALPRLIPRRFHPLFVYAALELLIGILGFALLWLSLFVTELSRFYADNIAHGQSGILLRAAVCAVCLLLPTILMGATLPAIARWMESTREGVSRLGFFYGANIAGAVFGCLLAGFFLLRHFDMATATFVAILINLGVFLVSLVLGIVSLVFAAPKSRVKTADDTNDTQTAERVPGSWRAYVAILLSGLCALGAEVIWTRQLSLLLGATVYTFSIILAVFLIGLGIGSSVGAVLARNVVNPRAALAWCQLCAAAAIAWSAYALASSLPYWPVDHSLIDSELSSQIWLIFQMDIARCLYAMLPATCLWGASFPLALAAVAAPGKDSGKLVGGVYAANTIGAILGATAFSLVFVALLGTQQAQQALICLSAVAAFLMFFPLLRQKSETTSPSLLLLRRLVVGAVSLVLVAIAAAGLVWTVPDAPRGLIAYGRSLPKDTAEFRELEDPPRYIYVGEGMNASIAVSEHKNGVRNFHVSGKVVASNIKHDMRLQRMLGHVSALVHKKPKSVLIVGCGAGVTSGCFVVHPSIEKIVVCEIEPLIPPAAERYFGEDNHNVFKDKRVTVVYDDARHYILTTKEKFDIITSDPIHPWVKGAASLYSEEYFELCKKRLNPGGVVTQWVPLYQSTEAAVKSEIATFFKAFPGGTVWANDIEGGGYDLVLLGQTKPTRINIDKLDERLGRADHYEVRQSLSKIDMRDKIHVESGERFSAAMLMLATYAGQDSDLTRWLKDAEINTDGNLRLQYLAGMGLNLYKEEAIFDSMLKHYKFPSRLFGGSPKNLEILREVLEGTPNLVNAR